MQVRRETSYLHQISVLVFLCFEILCIQNDFNLQNRRKNFNDDFLCLGPLSPHLSPPTSLSPMEYSISIYRDNAGLIQSWSNCSKNLQFVIFTLNIRLFGTLLDLGWGFGLGLDNKLLHSVVQYVDGLTRKSNFSIFYIQ